MSWPSWSSTAPLPGVVPTPAVAAPVQSTLIAGNITSAPAVAAPGGVQYSPEQWAQMQQQNWQQWAQWQQQYQQWHQQYGAEYQKSMSAMGGGMVQPPLPAISSVEAAPPLPNEVKPPLPPEDPPAGTPSYNIAPPQATVGYSTAATAASMPQQPQESMYNKPPPQISRFSGGGRQNNWQQQQQQPPQGNQFSNNKRSYQGNDYYDGNKRQHMNDSSSWDNKGWQGNQQSNWQNNPPPQQSVANKTNIEELSEAEKKFDKEFAAWEAQFNKWKSQNAGHPDKEQYREYEKKWESWRNSLLERREQMRRKRLGLLGPTQPKTGGTPPNFNQPPPNMSQQPPQTNQRPPLLPNPNEFGNNSSFNKPPPNVNNEPLAFKHAPPQDPVAEDDNSGGDFLKSSTSQGGIPGLDLVKDDEEVGGDKRDVPENIIELDKEDADKNKQATAGSSNVPDFDAISKGINTILGDSKILNMLSMATSQQSQPPSTDVIPKNRLDDNSQQGFGHVEQNQYDQSNHSFEDRSNQGGEFYNQRESVNNFDDQTRSSFTLGPQDQDTRFDNRGPPNNRFGNMPPFGGAANNRFGSGFDEPFNRGGNSFGGPAPGRNNFNNNPPKPVFGGGNNMGRPPPGMMDNFNSEPPNFNKNLNRPPPTQGILDSSSTFHKDGKNFKPPGNIPSLLSSNFEKPPTFNSRRDSFGANNELNSARNTDGFNRSQGGRDSFGNDNFNSSRSEPQNRNFGRAGNDNNYEDYDDYGYGDAEKEYGDEQYNEDEDFDEYHRRFADDEEDNTGGATFDNSEQGNRFDNNRGRFDNTTGGRFDDNRARFNDRPEGRFDDSLRGRFNDRPEARFDNNGGRFDDRVGGRFDIAGGRFDDRVGGRFDNNAGAICDDVPPPMEDDRQEIPPEVMEKEKEDIFEPTTVVDYNHKSLKPAEFNVMIEPLHMFDYRHKPFNRIPLPQRPGWLSETVRNIREFDPLASRPFDRRVVDRYPPDNWRDDHRILRHEERRFEPPPPPQREDTWGRNNQPNYNEVASRHVDRRGPFDRRNNDWEREDDFEPPHRDHNIRRNNRYDNNEGNKQPYNRNRVEQLFPSASSNVQNKRPLDNTNLDEFSDEDMDFNNAIVEDNNKQGEDVDLQSGGGNLPQLSMPQNQSQEPQITMIEDLINEPGRTSRPPRIVIILRGPPGSGKTYLAKLIKDREVENGGSAPRILSLDDYFMTEQEKEIMEDGKPKKIKDMVYEFEAEMEESYRTSLMKSFKKTITDGYFPFIVVDNINDKVKYFGEMWSFAKKNGFQVYICQLDLDPQLCTKRNIHGRTEKEIEDYIAGWEPTPSHHPILDASALLQSAAIAEIEMEEVEQPANEETEEQEGPEDEVRSKWDIFDCSFDKLAKLDGVSKPLRPSRTMEEYLQLEEQWTPHASTKPGQKRVRWADLEERKQQEKMRAIGFVVGQTNWDRMMDPTLGGSALTQTKYIERVKKSYY